MQAAIEFLSGIAPIFTDYLVIFQSDEPLVHCMFDALKTMVLTILGRFLQPDLLKGIPMAVLCRIDLEKEDNYLLLESIDIDVKSKLKVCQKYPGVFHPLKSQLIFLQTGNSGLIEGYFFVA